MIDESDKVKDLLRWWMHTWESRDLILNQFTAITSPNPDTHGFSMDDMKSAIPDTVGKLEALRHESIDKYEWPTFTNSKANSLVAEIKQKAENIFALHLETLRLNRAHFFPEAYPDTVNDVDRQLRDFVNNNNKLTNYVIQESKQGDRKLHELMQLYRINISEQEAHTVTDHSHDMQEISNSAELSMKKLYSSAERVRVILGILGMAFWAAIFVICLIFLHFGFLSSLLWWCFFFLVGLSVFLVSLKNRGLGLVGTWQWCLL